MSIKIEVGHFDPLHFDAVVQAIGRFISTDNAQHVLSQIVDGKPIRPALFSYLPYETSPWDELNREPEPESVKVVNNFQAGLRPHTLLLDSELAQAYQNTTLHTREFKLRLLEIVATAFHDTAARLFRHYCIQTGLTTANTAQDTVGGYGPVNPPGLSYPTPFFHPDYQDHDQYPLGVADSVGYWAEYQMFGGVVLFNRGQSGHDVLDAYIHPAANFMIFKLSDYQLDQFVSSSLDGSPISSVTSSYSGPNHSAASTPVPFRAEKYAQRINPDESLAKNIFRNRCERRPFQMTPGYRRPTRLSDYPDAVEWLERYHDSNEGNKDQNGN